MTRRNACSGAGTTPDRCGAPFAYRTMVVLCLLAGVVAFAYRDASSNGFLFDDWPNIVDHEPVHMQRVGFAALYRAATEGRLARRPLANVTFAIDWWIGHGRPAQFIRTNVVLHIANAMLVYLLLVKILSIAGAASMHGWIAAALGAGIWAIHPIQVQSVTYIVQRMTEMAAFFTLLSVLAYVQARGASSNGRRVIWVITCILALALGAASKENAWLAPVLLVLSEFTLLRPTGRLLRSRLDRIVLGMLFLASALAAGSLLAHAGPLWEWLAPSYDKRDFTMLERLLTQPRVVAFHIGQIVWPLPGRFSLIHALPVSKSLLSPPTTLLAWVGVMAWVGVGLHGVRRPGLRAAAFALLWVPITLIVSSTVVALEMVFEHRMYLPAVGLAGLLAIGVQGMLARQRAHPVAVLAVMVALVAALVGATAARIPVWQTEWQVYEQATRVAPNHPRAFSLLGNALLDSRDFRRAEQAFRRLLVLDADYPNAYKYLGRAVVELGRRNEAEALFREAARRNPLDPDLWSNLGGLATERGAYDEALEHLRRALILEPEHRLARNNLAVLQHLMR